MVQGRGRRKAAEAYDRVEVRSRAALRSWLGKNHGTSRGIWVVAWKKSQSKVHVDAATIAEEALCFGWIDSLPRALDDERSMLLITPHRGSPRALGRGSTKRGFASSSKANA